MTWLICVSTGTAGLRGAMTQAFAGVVSRRIERRN